ncbi:MAG: PP2C family protein-serine/threonine phosphatase [Thermoanaerobaculia bacterium]
MEAQKDPLALLQRENEQLRRAVQELSTLLDLSRAIGASLDSGEIMRTIINRSLKAVNAQQGVITLVDPERKLPTATLVRANVSSSTHRPFRITESLLGWMDLNKHPLVVNDPRLDERFHGVEWDPDVTTLLSVPLLIKSELNGILTVFNKKDGAVFDSNDERLLAIIASHSAQIVENARLYEEERALLRMREQLHLAAQIQDHLLPTKELAIAGYDVAGKSLAAQEVGGDYYDFVPMNDGRWAVCLGDVSGKGLPASLLMANVQATIRLLVSMDLPATEAISRANSFLCRSTPTEKFVTFFFSVLDPATNTLTFCNAGHNPPFLLSGNERRGLRTNGLVLGMVDGFTYQQDSVKLLPDDLIVIYSDGVTEAIDPHEEEFGDRRLIDVARRHRAESAAEIVAAIADAVQEFGAQQAQQDDITIVVLKRTD